MKLCMYRTSYCFSCLLNFMLISPSCLFLFSLQHACLPQTPQGNPQLYTREHCCALTSTPLSHDLGLLRQKRALLQSL